jgi:hypothetical protein
MTIEPFAGIEYEVNPEELVRLLATPDQKDLREITDPIALFGTPPLDQDPTPRSLVPARMLVAV